VQKGGNLIFAPGDAGSILNEHGNLVESADLSALTGAKTANRRICREIKDIVVCAPDIRDVSGGIASAGSWNLEHDEETYFFESDLLCGAETLATANGKPLLYRRVLEKGNVFVFTWSFDAFMFKGNIIDHYDTGMDWIWTLVADKIALPTNLENEAAKTIYEIISAFPNIT
jgi:hypothetical protein